MARFRLEIVSPSPLQLTPLLYILEIKVKNPEKKEHFKHFALSPKVALFLGSIYSLIKIPILVKDLHLHPGPSAFPYSLKTVFFFQGGMGVPRIYVVSWKTLRFG